MIRELTENDRKVLKYERRMGYVFAILIVCFGGLINLFYFVTNKTEGNYLMISLIDFFILVLAYFVCARINRDINHDLKENNKELLKKHIDKKTEEKSYEVGSGALYIPVLGELFPKLWGHKMKETRRYFIYSGDIRHEVEKDIYDKLPKGSDIYIHYAKRSETVLDFSNTE